MHMPSYGEIEAVHPLEYFCYPLGQSPSGQLDRLRIETDSVSIPSLRRKSGIPPAPARSKKKVMPEELRPTFSTSALADKTPLDRAPGPTPHTQKFP